jgi:hypothetical protein
MTFANRNIANLPIANRQGWAPPAIDKLLSAKSLSQAFTLAWGRLEAPFWRLSIAVRRSFQTVRC